MQIQSQHALMRLAVVVQTVLSPACVRPGTVGGRGATYTVPTRNNGVAKAANSEALSASGSGHVAEGRRKTESGNARRQCVALTVDGLQSHANVARLLFR